MNIWERFTFKNWLEGLESYQRFKNLVNQKAQGRYFAFEKWFPQERIYLPINLNNQENSSLLKDINDAIEEQGYYVTDLANGYAQKKDAKNVVKIGKLLQQLYQKELKQLDVEFQNQQLSSANYQQQKIRYTNYWNDLISNFNARGTSGEFLVVISKNIHDIASMSTGRGWESCMTLGSGGHHQDVYCEVANGGFIAYLIRTDDKNIEHPVARIHIRRFDNKQGTSIAIPEETIYGEDVPEFLNVVKNWIKSKQGNIQPGFYSRKGGKYSDTFGNTRKTFVPPETTDVAKIQSWLTKWINMDKKEQKKFYPYFLNTIQSYFQSTEKFPAKFNQKLKNYLFSDATFQTGNTWSTQSTNQFLPAFSVKNPEIITQQDFEKAFNYAILKQENMIEKLIDTFPQFMSKELFQQIKHGRVKEKIAQHKPELNAYMKQQIEQDAEQVFDVNNPAFKVTKNDSIHFIYGRIYDELQKLHNLKPIPEKIIRKLVDFANGVDKLQLRVDRQSLNPLVTTAEEADAQLKRNDIVGDIINTFNMTGSDTPTVQRFYKSLLPKWEELGGISVLGNAILSLKENGKQFLPFLIQKKEEFIKNSTQHHPEEIQKNKRNYEDAIEMYDYVIDSLQKPDFFSKKYKPSFGKGFEYWLAHQDNKKKKDALRDAIINRNEKARFNNLKKQFLVAMSGIGKGDKIQPT